MGSAVATEQRHWTLTTIAIEPDGTVVLHVRPTREWVPCPGCGALSRRRHSWYTRRALDLPWRGATVRLWIRSRRSFWGEPSCPRRIFAERFDGLLGRGARRTGRPATSCDVACNAEPGEFGEQASAAAGPCVPSRRRGPVPVPPGIDVRRPPAPSSAVPSKELLAGQSPGQPARPGPAPGAPCRTEVPGPLVRVTRGRGARPGRVESGVCGPPAAFRARSGDTRLTVGTG